MNNRLLALSVAAVAVSFTTAYGAGTYSSGAGAAVARATVSPAPEVTPTAEESPTGAASPETSPTATASESASPVGPGCAALPSSGPGSPAELANEPVGTALSHIPTLSTLATAAQKAGVVQTLNSAEDITVFAPSNDAFNKIPKNQLDKILADRQALSTILANHVVKGRKTPADLEHGSFTTLQGGTITTSRSGETFKVNDATVVCGGLRTRNATVYIVDTVLKPTAGTPSPTSSPTPS
ncbi:fasciclin domain-containing protein [Planotetraspora sp. GP83]|uniref:fasciclin domain-containing protein n=1 Tax=Planotetraspora sp. GP83 TaxID=3156264 RepID=UPI003515C6C1